MKTTFIKLILNWLCIICLVCSINQLYAQEHKVSSTNRSLDFGFASLKTPELKRNQTVKALITISPDSRDNEFLTRTSEGLVIEERSFVYFLKKNQLWWLVQDYKLNAFALVSVDDGTDWMYLDSQENGTNSLRMITNDQTENEYIDDNYFFEFVMPYVTQEDKHYLIQSIATTDQYWKSNDTTLASQNLDLNDSAPYTFTFRTFRSFENKYISVPTYDSAFHSIETLESGAAGSEYTKISANEAIAPIDDNTAIVGSGDITILKRGGSEDMFQVIFENDAIAKIGLLDYNVSKYTKEVLQTPGSRKLFSGIEMNEDGEIYLFNKGIEKYTEFVADTPIVFGYDNGTLVARQDTKSYTMTGVPTPILLNGDSGNYSRLITISRKGSVQLSYKPQAIIVSGEDFGELNAPAQHNTDPQFSYAPSNGPTNAFDWRQRIYPIAFENQGTPNTIFPLSPFYTTGDPDLYPVASKQSASGTYLGGEDFSSIDGWEMIQMDFGYDENGLQKEDLRGEPYMVLYNRFTGTLRVFLYIHNSSIANNLRVSLVDKKTQTISGRYHQPRLWSSYLQGKALDNPTLGSEAYSKSVRLYNTSESKFYYVDFIFNYDPCTCFFESNLQIKVDKVTQGSMEIVGKTLGGSIPAGADGYDEWMANSDSYLTGVMDTPYGEQSQSLGDISLKSLNEWEDTPWSNETDLTIPGRKVPDWEREALRLQYRGTAAMAAGDFLSAAGKAVKAVSEAGDLGFINLGSGGKAVGEGMDAAGTAMKGGGRATTAAAVKIRLDNLADEPDQTTTLSFPPPQPSMVFAELAAKGTLTIETPVFDNVVITTPGSKNAEYAPIETGNNTKGAFPFYNEPLGVFNLVYTPRVAISVVKNQNDKFGAHFRLKEKPYITTNMDKIQGTEFGFFTANYVITTYNSEGYSVNSRRTKPYMISNGIDIDKQLPTSLDITRFIDQNTLAQNLNSLSGNTAASLKRFISVTLEIDYMGLSGVGESGKQNGEIIRQSYDAITDFSYATVSALTPDLNQLAEDKAMADFAEYDGSNNGIWEENYLITKNTEGFDNKMLTFCEQTVPYINSSYRSVAQGKNGNETENKTSDTSEELTSELEEVGFVAYPNPSKRDFNINYYGLTEGKVDITISDLSGRVILSHTDVVIKKGEQKSAHINLQQLSGVYILNIQFEDGESYTTKLVKEN
ncbi:T9SS type A sorting domain-containing protein [uncultured Aquimarina sp.]|uniref:T9SS type A sorting domain-containing protein n=1 Tax=uncultured Aquimarina sp. TaxID=575652 RepID=UPI0026190E5B|nr:T9SS type A sorting domain-containing protein [uncultured Aquimarina sp.]